MVLPNPITGGNDPYDLGDLGFRKNVESDPQNKGVPVDYRILAADPQYLLYITDFADPHVQDEVVKWLGDYGSGIVSFGKDFAIAFYHFAARLGLLGAKQQEYAKRRNQIIITVFKSLCWAVTGDGPSVFDKLPKYEIGPIDENNHEPRIEWYKDDRQILSITPKKDKDGKTVYMIQTRKMTVVARLLYLYFKHKFTNARLFGRFTGGVLLTSGELYLLRRYGIPASGTLGTAGNVILRLARWRWQGFLKELIASTSVFTFNLVIMSCGSMVRHIMFLEKEAGGPDKLKFVSILDLLNAFMTGNNEAISKEIFDMYLNEALVPGSMGSSEESFPIAPSDLDKWEKLLHGQELYFNFLEDGSVPDASDPLPAQPKPPEKKAPINFMPMFGPG